MEVIAYLLLTPFIVATYFSLESRAHWKSQADHWHEIAQSTITAYNNKYMEKKNE
jgi:hypothetical protein